MKRKMILTMVAMASMAAFAGCSSEVSLSDSKNTGTSTVVIEASMENNAETGNATTNGTQNNAEASTASTNSTQNTTENNQNDYIIELQSESNDFMQAEEEEEISDELGENGQYVIAGEEFTYFFEPKYDENACKEYATITCYGDKGSYWMYETDKYDVGQCSTVEFLESQAECIFINEGGTIIALDATNGNILWQNSEYQGSGSVSTMDEKGYLYVAGYFSPALMIIDTNGNTVYRVAQFGDYFWPYDMFLEDNMLTILFDSADNAKVIMDIRDYSYTIG